MKITFSLIVLIAIFGLAVAAEKGDESLVATMADLAKERQEIKEIFRRENEQLRVEAENLRGQDEKLRHQDYKLRKEVAKLRRELRKSDLRVKTSLRQKDQNESLEFKEKLRQSIRENEVLSELKAMMKGEIQEFLKVERICESGLIDYGWGKELISQTKIVQFSKTFLRPPTVHAAFQGYTPYAKDNRYATHITVKETTTSSVKIFIQKGEDVNYFKVGWIACL